MNNNLLEEIVDRKKRDDPIGFSKAQREDRLTEYLAFDLYAIGVDPCAFKLSYQNPKSNGFNGTYVLLPRFVVEGSEILDVLYSRLYKQGDCMVELMLASIPHYDALSFLNIKLKTPKVIFAAAGSFCLVNSLDKLLSRKGAVLGIVFAVLSADLFRMSYNCYIKKYCELVGRNYFGSMERTGNTFLSWAQSSMGIKDESENPIRRVQVDLIWEAVLADTITEKIINQRIKNSNLAFLASVQWRRQQFLQSGEASTSSTSTLSSQRLRWQSTIRHHSLLSLHRVKNFNEIDLTIFPSEFVPHL
eukprot:gene7963-16299_t